MLQIKPQISEGGKERLLIYQEVFRVDDTSGPGRGSIADEERSLDWSVTVDDEPRSSSSAASSVMRSTDGAGEGAADRRPAAASGHLPLRQPTEWVRRST